MRVLTRWLWQFGPSDANKRYVEYCRKQLRAEFPFAIEFRNTEWMSDGQRDASLEWMRGLQLVYVA